MRKCKEIHPTVEDILEEHLDRSERSDTELLDRFFHKHDQFNNIPREDQDQEYISGSKNIVKLLKEQSNTPTHFLFYGTSDISKKSYALAIAQKLGLIVYELELKNDDQKTPDSKQIALAACLDLFNKESNIIIIVDEAHRFLNTDCCSLSDRPLDTKFLINFLEEHKNAKMIWITDSIGSIEKAVLEKFTYNIQFKPFTTTQRLSKLMNILHEHNAKDLLTQEDVECFAKKYQFNISIFNNSVLKSLKISNRSKKEFKEALTLLLDAANELINGKQKIVTTQAHVDHDYILDGLNIDADLNLVIHQLKSFDKLRDSRKEAPKSINLLFYGCPGTGKSELARYIGNILGKDIIAKTPSDILDPYIGKSEQHIRSAFIEADEHNAILVFDEIDTMLFSRTNASKSWEVSLTNEFLVRMAEFSGIFIGTTNMLTNLDHASLRRFQIKIEFKYLTPEGKVIFYNNLLRPLVTETINDEVLAELKMIPNLAPGDFKIIRDQYYYQYPRIKLKHDILIQELKRESSIKKIHSGINSRRIGFI